MAVAFRAQNLGLDTKSGAKQPTQKRPQLSVISKQRSSAPVVIVVMLLLFVTLFGVVALRTHMAQQQRVIDDLTVDLVRARNHFDELRAERARLQSPDVLVDAARTMGMVPTSGAKLVDIPPVVAAQVAETLGKVDLDFVKPVETTLDTFGNLKAQVSVTP